MMARTNPPRTTYSMSMDSSPATVLTVDPRALSKLLEIRATEPDADELGLVLSIVGIDHATFAYEMVLMRPSDAAPGDHTEQHGELTVIIPKADVENLRGAELTMSPDLLNPGLRLNNPNSPSPRIVSEAPLAELSGPVAERVVQVIENLINPAIAAHGGMAEVVAVEDTTVYVRLGGGCQGCGMASVTLSQGIEETIRVQVPEITKVVDVTDHAGGTNPYYEQAKK